MIFNDYLLYHCLRENNAIGMSEEEKKRIAEIKLINTEKLFYWLSRYFCPRETLCKYYVTNIWVAVT